MMWFKAFIRRFGVSQRGASLIELGIATTFLLLPILMAIAGFERSTLENSSTARGLNEAVGIEAQGHLQNLPTGNTTQDAATEQQIETTAYDAFLAATNQNPNQIFLHFMFLRYNTSTSSFVVLEGTKGGLSIPSSAYQYQYATNGNTLKTPTSLTLEASDRLFAVEGWVQHTKVLNVTGQLGVAYGSRVEVR